ncbi:MAG: type 1 glutamine amidotransferase domain-containing protein [Luteolibacter sp.]|uniref:type 1 glutamine amidotransferase domain-containing protein n=1 Tax=Luteolibacter sp. TaxID=1962973 RepID=UPI003265A6F2
MKTDFKQLKMNYDLSGKRVAVLATDGFEQSELDVPVQALKTCGAEVHIVAPEPGTIRGWSGKDWGEKRQVTKILADASADDYDSLVLPGGVINSDRLRTLPDAVEFAREFFEQQKPVAAICHAAQLLIEADVVEGRAMTSYPSIRIDLENAGALWEDQSVVVDQGLTTSRSPEDLPDFCEKLCEEILEGIHRGQHA